MKEPKKVKEGKIQGDCFLVKKITHCYKVNPEEQEILNNILVKHNLKPTKSIAGKFEGKKISVTPDVTVPAYLEIEEALGELRANIKSNYNKAEIRRTIAQVLVENVEKNQIKLEYGELSKLLNDRYSLDVDKHFGLKHYFDKISRKCHELGLPLISAIIVSKDTQKPSSGFYMLYDELYGTHNAGNPVFEERCLASVKLELLEEHNWEKLLLEI